jgi:hypothetical protein
VLAYHIEHNFCMAAGNQCILWHLALMANT